MTRDNRLLLAAIVCAVIAGVLTFRASGERPAEGATRSVVVSSSAIASGSQLDERAISNFKTSRIPARYAPPDAISDSVDALGSRVLVDLPAGAVLTQAVLASGGSADQFKLRAGERAVSVEVVASPSEHVFVAGETVDLLASGFGGDQRTSHLIAGAEILAVVEGSAPGKPRLTLRLAATQVSPVVRADVFAHELRAVQVPAR